MATNARRRIQFIHISNPATRPSADAQRRAHSHAARETHARARRLRTVNYLSRNNTRHAPECQEREDHDPCVNRDAVDDLYPPSTKSNLKVESTPIPSPASLLASDRRDPFASFAMPFKPMEHFLLDHCMCFSLHTPNPDRGHYSPASLLT
jgi:hypothetical protein